MFSICSFNYPEINGQNCSCVCNHCLSQTNFSLSFLPQLANFSAQQIFGAVFWNDRSWIMCASKHPALYWIVRLELPGNVPSNFPFATTTLVECKRKMRTEQPDQCSTSLRFNTQPRRFYSQLLLIVCSVLWPQTFTLCSEEGSKLFNLQEKNCRDNGHKGLRLLGSSCPNKRTSLLCGSWVRGIHPFRESQSLEGTIFQCNHGLKTHRAFNEIGKGSPRNCSSGYEYFQCYVFAVEFRWELVTFCTPNPKKEGP